MTREDIIRMARAAGLYEDCKFFVLEHGELAGFAALVAAAEREACAKAAVNTCVADASNYPLHIAAAIRARSKT